MAIAGIGCRFQKLYSSGWADVAEVMSIDGPSPERDTYDTTTINTEGNYRTFIPGLKDGGEVTMEMNYTPESYLEFKTDFNLENEEALVWYSVVFNDNDGNSRNCIVFQAMVTSVGATIPTDEKVSSNVTLKVSGNPKYTTVGIRNSNIDNPREITENASETTNKLYWRGYQQPITAEGTVILPIAAGGNGNSITYSLTPNPGTSFTAGTQGVTFDASTRTLAINKTNGASNSQVTSDALGFTYSATQSGGSTISQAVVIDLA